VVTRARASAQNLNTLLTPHTAHCTSIAPPLLLLLLLPLLLPLLLLELELELELVQ